MTDNTDNIVLIGMMGSGKTSVGQAISKAASIPFVDTDTLIERRLDMTIPHIFEQYGESYFRRFESEAALEVAALSGQVIATGGGMVINPQNMKHLSDTGFVVYLRASAKLLLERTGGDENRPLLGKLDSLLAQRAPLYEKYSDLIVDAMDIEEIVRVILYEYSNYQRAKY